jgi:DDE superfamily endonuclease
MAWGGHLVTVGVDDEVCSREDQVATTSIVSGLGGVGQDELRRFRNELHDCFSARADALFELVDGLCCPVAVGGVAHVTLAVGCRRGHGSAYAALAHGRVDVEMLRDVLVAFRPSEWVPDFAVDASTWVRSDAECSPERGFYYHPSRHSAGQPIVAGWSFLWIAGLHPAPDSWTAPVDVCRPAVADNVNTVAVARIAALLRRLPPRPVAALFAFDAGFDPVQLSVGLAPMPAQVVVRIRDDRKFFTRPAPPTPGRGGRPRRHGARFSCADPGTWPTPDAVHHCDDARYGRVHVQAWHRLHPHQRTYREPAGAMSIVEATIVRVQVSRLPGRRDRAPKTLWLWWTGPDPAGLDLDRVWRAYIRRFDLEHTFRFAKSVLGWTTPKLRTPAQAERWTWLIIAALTQLRLARDRVGDHRLPWQPPLPAARMTPGRVRNGFGHLLPRLGSPASWPKHTRPGPGRPKGRKSTPATRYPAQKKHNNKSPKKVKRP